VGEALDSKHIDGLAKFAECSQGDFSHRGDSPERRGASNPEHQTDLKASDLFEPRSHAPLCGPRGLEGRGFVPLAPAAAPLASRRGAAGTGSSEEARGRAAGAAEVAGAPDGCRAIDDAGDPLAAPAAAAATARDTRKACGSVAAGPFARRGEPSRACSLSGLGGPDGGDTFETALALGFAASGASPAAAVALARGCLGRPDDAGRAWAPPLPLLPLPPALLDPDRAGEALATAPVLGLPAAVRPRSGDAANRTPPPLPLRSRLRLRSLLPMVVFRARAPPGLRSLTRPRPGVAFRCFSNDGRGAGTNPLPRLPLMLIRLLFSLLPLPGGNGGGGGGEGGGSGAVRPRGGDSTTTALASRTPS
jgi:hypothetical protein